MLLEFTRDTHSSLYRVLYKHACWMPTLGSDLKNDRERPKAKIDLLHVDLPVDLD